MGYKRTRLIKNGKANDVYELTDPMYFELESTDRVSAQNGKKRDIIPGKGKANNKISTILFRAVEKRGVPTHFVCEGNTEASKIVMKLDMIPLEVIGRYYATGSFQRKYGCQDMMPFDDLYIEFTYKCDASDDPLITEDAIVALGIASREDIKRIKMYTQVIGHVQKEFYEKCGVQFVDFKIEFGRDAEGNIILADEMSPDTSRLRDLKTGDTLDKDRFRKDMGGVEEAYAEMLKRAEKADNE